MAVPNLDYKLCHDFEEYLAYGYYIWVQRQLEGTRLDAVFEAQAFRFLQRPVSPPQQPVADEGHGSQGKCIICGRVVKNNFAYHMKCHHDYNNWDFNCKFRQLGGCGLYRGPSRQPRYCIEHMLHIHLKFDGIKRPWRHKGSILLQKYGECACGYHGLAKTWVDEHVLGDQCPLIDEQFESDHEEKVAVCI